MADMLAHEAAYRGNAAMQAIAALPVTMCGAGAVGSNLVDNMVRQGFRAIRVVDMDRVEVHNIPTQVWTKREVGQYKAAMLKNGAFASCGAILDAVTQRLEERNAAKVIGRPTLVVDGFDNHASRALVAKHCTDTGTDCLHVGLAKDYAEVIWNESYRVPDDTTAPDVCDYPMARNTIMLAVAVATEAVIRYAVKKEKHSYVITLGDFRVEEI